MHKFLNICKYYSIKLIKIESNKNKTKQSELAWESWPLETSFWMELEIDLLALTNASGSVSTSHTSKPCMTPSWAIPEPIWPLPTTPITFIVPSIFSTVTRSLSASVNMGFRLIRGGSVWCSHPLLVRVVSFLDEQFIYGIWLVRFYPINNTSRIQIFLEIKLFCNFFSILSY